MMRLRYVYGIRRPGSGELAYVGTAFDLEARKKQRYNLEMMAWLDSGPSEYVILELIVEEESDEREAYWFELACFCRHRLLNKRHPLTLAAVA